MSDIYYDINNHCFLSTHIHSIPADAIPLTDADYESLLDGQSHGLRICAPDAAHAKPWLAEPNPPTLEQQQSVIDAETSAAIIAGFDYVVGDDVLHFSYDIFDQQNFADTANACILAMQGLPGLPQTVTWSGYRMDAQGKNMVRVALTAQEFLALYVGGALAHKATQMEIGGARKAALLRGE